MNSRRQKIRKKKVMVEVERTELVIGTEKETSATKILLVQIEDKGNDENINEAVKDVVKHYGQKQKIQTP